MDQVRRRSNWILAAFTTPCLPLAGLGLPLVVYLPQFYASDLGLPLSRVGFAFMAVRLLDMAFDPFIGAVMDRTRTRLGRFRLWFGVAAPIVMAGAYMLFMAKPGVTAVYLWVWLLVVYGGFSIATLAQMAWGAVLSAQYDQRSRIYAWWQGGNVVGMILILTLPAGLPLLGIKAPGAGLAAMGWFIVALTPLTFALSILRVPEPRIFTAPKRSGWREYLALAKRPTVARLLGADLLVGVGPAITGALFFFYFEQVKGFGKGAASLLLLVYFIGGLAGSPIWTWLAYKVGKHRALALAGLAYALATASITLIPIGNTLAGAAMMFLIGLPYSAGLFLLRAMMADVGDEERLESGAERTGLLYALLSGAAKISSAGAVGVTFWILDITDFDAKTVGLSDNTTALSILFLLAPITCSLLASWIMMGYRLTSLRHAEIRRALDGIDEAGQDQTSDPSHALASTAF
jgi:glycoside/pentoside/hexuronide:cation symporter, GPH family